MKNSADQKINLERDIYFSANPKATQQDFNAYLLQRIDLVKEWIKAGENVESNTQWIETIESYLAEITNGETIENNRLIAEFMDFDFLTYDKYQYNSEIMHSLPEFSNDWNWLMVIIGKIEDLGYKFHITSIDATALMNNGAIYQSLIYTIDGLTKKQATYKTIIEFIKWYNENK